MSLPIPSSRAASFEIVHPHPRGGFRFALFDFDGTLSLIREGWQDVMIPLMIEQLRNTPQAEQADVLRDFVGQLVEETTGLQTIFQMIRLRDEVARRGGVADDPSAYKAEYNRRLLAHIQQRVAGLRAGTITRTALMVPGAEEMLADLRQHDVTLFLASGTDQCYVDDECRALGLAEYFNGGIYGAQEDYQNFSKKLLIERIYRDHGLQGPELLAFGDGFVEIMDTKAANGVAVGVASDEVGCQKVNTWKRTRLIEAGADLIIPHFRQHADLITYLFTEE